MKKQILLLSLFCGFLQPLAAQLVSFVGVQGGYTLSRISNVSGYPDHVPGFKAGISARSWLSRRFCLLAELNYETKGAQGSIQYTDSTGNEISSEKKDLSAAYLTLPVMARYYEPVGRKLHLFAEAGLYYGYLLKAIVSPAEPGTSGDVTSSFKRNDFGLTGGVGAEYRLKRGHAVSLGWRYGMGVLNVSDLPLPGGGWRSSSHLFQLGFAYSLNKPAQHEHPHADF